MTFNELFSAVLARGAVERAVSGQAWVRAMLDVEAALALGSARVGLVPASAAQEIAAVCQVLDPDVRQLGQEADSAGNPVVPLVRRIEAACSVEAGPWVHRGATSQDVVDTAAVLLVRRAVVLLQADMDACVEAAAGLARRHRHTVMAGRTLLQQAVPTTFGLKAAGWMTAMSQVSTGLDAVVARLPVQLGGAVGTLSAAGPRGLDVVDAFAAELDLQVPVLAWHTLRTPIADVAGALGTTCGVLGKVALDVVLLAQTEVAEVWEGVAGRGGSSTMPHKRNPVAAVSARAAALRAPGLVATMLTAMHQEHERAAGAWHAEWLPLGDLLTVTGSAASWLADCLGSLDVDPARMRANLAASGPVLAAEAVADALTTGLGRARAHEAVRAAAESSDFRASLLEDERVRRVISAERLDQLLDPSAHVGLAGALVDRALAVLEGSMQ